MKLALTVTPLLTNPRRDEGNTEVNCIETFYREIGGTLGCLEGSCYATNTLEGSWTSCQCRKYSQLFGWIDLSALSESFGVPLLNKA